MITSFLKTKKKRLRKSLKINIFITPKGIRIPVTSVKGKCPRPLDDGGLYTEILY